MEYKELIDVLKEKGIDTNRTQFFCDNLNVNLDKQIKWIWIHILKYINIFYKFKIYKD